MTEATTSSTTVIPFPAKPPAASHRRGDPFTAKKLAWLDRIFFDENKISPLARCVAYNLASKFLNRATGQAQVDQETLAHSVSITSRALRGFLKELAAAGYLRVIKPQRPHPGGRAIRNRYQPIFDAKQEPPVVTLGNDPPPKTYAFSGRVVRVDQEDLDRWRHAYPHIADMRATLQACDDYLSHQEDSGNWFFRASMWLKRENEQHAKKANGEDRHSW